MKKLFTLPIVFIMLLVGCSNSETSEVSLTSSEYIDKLKTSGQPIGVVVNYTADTDPNELLGRPNQYTSKTNFADTTLEQSDSNDPIGGSVEVFESKSDAEKRKKYIDSIGKEMPQVVEYSYINGTALLRLDKSLTPEQAKKYEDAFMAIK